MTRLGGGGMSPVPRTAVPEGRRGYRPKTEHASCAGPEDESCTTYRRTKGGKGVWAGDYGVGLMG